jgi:GNAT superfamily N-acetyltransferase
MTGYKGEDDAQDGMSARGAVYNSTTGTMITFRPMNLETDAADMARIYSFTTVEPITEKTARNWWTLRTDEVRFTTLALDENKKIIGYWDVDHETWVKPGRFFIKVIVVPEFRSRKLGAQMYADALRVAREHGATELASTVREDDVISWEFAEKRGFKIEFHSFDSTLDLAHFDENKFDDLMTRVHAEGFRFFSLAEAGLTKENQHRLYEVNREAALDNPGNGGSFPDFYTFSKNVFDAAWFRADTQIIASIGDRWVGLAAIGLYPEEKYAYNAFTGVLREYRGRGLAQSLKLQTILLAKKEGARYIRTNNDSQNAPMLAVNRKLGYQPETGHYSIFCALNSIDYPART